MDHIPEPVRYFLGKRLAELCGLLLFVVAGCLALALLTWSVQDPSFNHATSGPVRNLLGDAGAMAADLTMQMVGVAATAILVPLSFWGWRLVTHRRLERLGLRSRTAGPCRVGSAAWLATPFSPCRAESPAGSARS